MSVKEFIGDGESAVQVDAEEAQTFLDAGVAERDSLGYLRFTGDYDLEYAREQVMFLTEGHRRY